MRDVREMAALRPVGIGLRGVMVGAVLAAAAVGCQSQTGSEVQWGYSAADGPTQWGALSADFAMCKDGEQQSPIDLTDAKAGDLPPLKLDWTTGNATLLDNGHAIQVNLPASGDMTLGDRTYGLAQFHVHTPSEHTVDGKQAPLEIHFVHADAKGGLAVVGVMVQEGEAHPALDPLIAAFDSITPEGAGISLGDFDPRALLPDGEGRMAYPGSLTTPPCSEGVAWNVMTTPITASAAQIAAFVARYPDNARPVQPLEDRSLTVDRPARAMR